jgi:membrane protein implicated in regulation of membrane protease activity
MPGPVYPPGVLFLLALVLAIFVLPSPWGLYAVVVAGVIDIAETWLFLWWSNRRRATVGVETLVGKPGVAVGDLWPGGQVKVDGEIWQARCEGGCDAGTRVVVRAVEGLTLVVDPA